MYKKPFYITTPVWNNKLSFEKIPNKKLFVPSLISFAWEIKITDEITFCDVDFDWNLQICSGLENFYKFNYKNIPLYLFDNHNHAFYFWYEEFFKNNLTNSSLLIHIDEHSDLRIPENIPEKINNLEEAFNYTNFELNVWNYIIPAQKLWLIWDMIQIRNEYNLENIDYNKIDDFSWTIILNIDLDFFEPELDYIDYNLKKKIILELCKKANVITVATSPFFINQKLAIKVFTDIFL